MDWSSAESAVDERSSLTKAGHMTDHCSDVTDNSPPLQLHTLKEFEQHLNDLKKENFSLKLRIYFLEERIQQKYEESSDHVYRSNIELKVEVESLKQELQEKQQLLEQTLTRAESLTNHNEADLQQRCDETQQEIHHMQQILESKVARLQEEALLARSEEERKAPVSGSPSPESPVTPDCPMEDPRLPTATTPTHTDKLIERLGAELVSKEGTIKDLTFRVEELEGHAHLLTCSLLQKDKDIEFYQEELSQERLRIEQEMQSLVEEQQSRLNQYECAAAQCVSELQTAQQEVTTLNHKVTQSHAHNLKLQEKLDEMECELRSLRQTAQSRERTIQGLTDSISTKDSEAQELYQLIDGQNSTLCQLQELAHHNQLSQHKPPPGGEALTVWRLQSELVGVQSSLFSLELELEASRRSLRQSQRQERDLVKVKDRLSSDFQEALQHREETEKQNQELRCSLHQLRSELQEKDSVLKESQEDGRAALEERERTIAQLHKCLQHKEMLLEEVSELQESMRSSKPRDVLLEKMKERLKERDKVLEGAIDERFRDVEEHEAQVRSLQVALREKERDLERLRCILSNNEETITSLEAVVRGRGLELEQSAEAYRNLQCLTEKNLQTDRNTLREKDALITELEERLHTHAQDVAALMTGVQGGPGDAVEQLKARLQLKEKLLQDLLLERRRQSDQHHGQIQLLLDSLSGRDQDLKDSSHRLAQVINEQQLQLTELRRQLSLKQQEVMELRRAEERVKGGEVVLKEKEALIQELLGNQENKEEVRAREVEELHQVLKKEKEAQEELSALRSASQDQTKPAEHRWVELVVREYEELNEALRKEKRFYQSLAHLHQSDGGSVETPSLLTELDSVQALRGQLDGVLARTRRLALQLELAATQKPDFGELSSDDDDDDEEEGEDEEGSSEEFTDSIEEENEEQESRASRRWTFLQAESGVLQDPQVQLENHQSPSVAPIRNSQQIPHPIEPIEPVEPVEINTQNPRRRWRNEEVEEEEEKACPVVAGKRPPPFVSLGEEPGKRRCVRPSPLDETRGSAGGEGVDQSLREQAASLTSNLALSQQENRELLEKLVVCEAMVEAQEEQLKDFRILLMETSVQKVSKLIQVDLQDLGYETSGRSENEAEREETSSPEFDDLEMCTSLSHHQEGDGGTGGWYAENRCASRAANDRGDESALVQDLRSQLDRCHKVIRGLQLRLRSLSITSDYASSLERTPCKVNWTLEASAEEDEGWMSDNQGNLSKPSSALQQLMSRVESLEAQLKIKGKAEEERCSPWPEKYNSLIQAQARELSNLRQRTREGQGVCHILTQHLGDTTKAFEELLRANDIDYFMGQSFREQLAQSSALAQRVGTKISGGESVENHQEKTGHELLAMRLSKELQQKDHIIQSLHTKLQQRPETPSSCHAVSETTDRSDRTSLVSDEYQTTEDEYQTTEDVDLETDNQKDSDVPPPVRLTSSTSGPSKLPSDHPVCPSVLQFSPPSFHQDQLSGVPVRAGSGWYVDDLQTSPPQPEGRWLMEEHLQEVKFLLQRLEESIQTNERLTEQLEEKRDGGAPTNIYIQGLDTVTQLSNQIRVLKEENLSLLSRLQASSDSREEVLQLREAAISGCARLKQAELEAEQWKEELRRVQTHSQDQGQQLLTLRQEAQENSNRLQHEVCVLQQQMCESRGLVHSLQTELQVYDGVCSTNANKGYLCEVPALPVELGELLQEVRSLRAQLQVSVQENSALKQLELHKQLEQKLGGGSPRTLTASPQRENFCRRLLLHDPAPSPPVRDIGLFNCGSPSLPYSDLEDPHSSANDPLDPHSELEGEAPDGSFANRNGRHAVGHVDDFGALQQQVLEGRSLVQCMETTLEACLSPLLIAGSKDLVYDSVKSLQSNTKTLRLILEEASSLMKMFWRAALPSTETPVHSLKREQSLQEELLSLKLRMSEQEEVLKGTIQRLRSTSRTKENMEHFILSQLSRTREVLKKARTNLEKNERRLSSSSHCAAEDCGGGPGGRPADGRVLTSSDPQGFPASHRPAVRKRSSQCLL